MVKSKAPNKDSKNYALETDILETSGIEALTRFAENDNFIFVDVEELEKLAKDKKNRNRDAIEEVLKFLTKEGTYNSSDETITIGEGKVIHYGKKARDRTDLTHITKDPSNKSKLLREGKTIDEPQFLIYGEETLYQGIQFFDYNGDPHSIKKYRLEELIEKAQINPVNNQYFVIKGKNDEIAVFQLKYDLIKLDEEGTRFVLGEEYRFIKIESTPPKSHIPNFSPRNLEQSLAFQSIIDSESEVIFITGGSGSGKTVSAYGAAVNCILTPNSNQKEIILFKPDDILGGKKRDPGALPGGMDKKKAGIMESFKDAHKAINLQSMISYENMLKTITGPSRKERKKNLEKQMEGTEIEEEKIGFQSGTTPVTLEYLQFARGRTFEGKIIYIDEAQNYTPFEMKQLIERAGKRSKIIISGDPEQLDDPARLDKNYNGLVYAAKCFYDTHPRVSFVHLDENFRLQAADIMRRNKAPMD